jgi:hypothetical protein
VDDVIRFFEIMAHVVDPIQWITSITRIQVGGTTPFWALSKTGGRNNDLTVSVVQCKWPPSDITANDHDLAVTTIRVVQYTSSLTNSSKLIRKRNEPA